jgi:hypothetical protein
MKLWFYILTGLYVVLFSACMSVKRDPSSEKSAIETPLDAGYATLLKFEVERYISTVEKTLVLREQGMLFYRQNQCKIDPDAACRKAKAKDVLSHADLETLYKGGQEYLDLRNHLKFLYVDTFGIKYKDLLAGDITFKPSLSGKFSYDSRTRTLTYGISDRASREFMMELKMALSAAYLLYDNYLVLVHPYINSSKISYQLNRDFPQGRDRWFQLEKSFKNEEQRILVAKVTKLFQLEVQFQKSATALAKAFSPREAYLEELIEQSPFYRMVIEGKASTDWFGPIEIDLKKFDLDWRWYSRGGTFYLSKFFGNSMGLFQFRNGKLKEMPFLEKQAIRRKAKSMDIILEKTPFRLTDKFIPGYYGHAAIWVGTESELRELKYEDSKTKKMVAVWNHPRVVPHQSAIRAGRNIIEALRPGVEINSIEHFLDIDDLLIMRDNNLTDEERARMAIRAFEQVGKEYDFNFDVETDQRIVCSEIVYVVYHGYDWPTDKALGRYTISPDHVAWEGEGGCFTPVSMYVEGKEVKNDLNIILSEVLNGSEGIAHAPRRGCHRTENSFREPAAEGTFFSRDQVASLSNLLSAGKPDYSIRHNMEVRVWNDIPNNYLKVKADKAVDEAIRRTFSDASSGDNLLKDLKTNLINKFSENFLLTLNFYKILDGDIRFDFYFLPQHEGIYNQATELGSNQLVAYGTYHQSLTQKLEQLKNRNVVQEVYNFVSAKTAASPSQPQYVGGAISMHIKLLSTTLTDRIFPNIVKRGIQGNIRYRRYMALNPATLKELSSCLGTPAPVLATVDLFQKYNLNSYIPSDDRIEIYPGSFISAAEGIGNVMPKNFEFVGSSISQGSAWNGLKIVVKGDEVSLEIQNPQLKKCKPEIANAFSRQKFF